MPENTTQPKDSTIVQDRKVKVDAAKANIEQHALTIEMKNLQWQKKNSGKIHAKQITEEIEQLSKQMEKDEIYGDLIKEYEKQNKNLQNIKDVINKGQKKQENKINDVMLDVATRLEDAVLEGNEHQIAKLDKQLEQLQEIQSNGTYNGKATQIILEEIKHEAKNEENLKAIKEVGKTLKEGYEKQLQELEMQKETLRQQGASAVVLANFDNNIKLLKDSLEKGTWESVSVQRQIAINQEVAKKLQKEEEDREAARREREVKRLIESQKTIADRVSKLGETLRKDLTESSAKLGKDMFGLMSGGMSAIIAESFGSGPVGMIAMSIFGALESSLSTLATHGYDALKAMLFTKPLQAEIKQEPKAQNILQRETQTSTLSPTDTKSSSLSGGSSTEPPKGAAGWLSGIADAIKPFGDPAILRAATAMLVVATSVGVLGGAVLLFAQSSLGALMKTIVGMGALVATMYAISKIEKDIYQGSMALLSIASSIAIMAGAFILFNYVDWGTVLIGAAAIGILIGVVVLLGVFAKFTLIGAAVLLKLAISMGIFAVSALIFSTALIMLAGAFTILGPAMLSFLAFAPLIIPFGFALVTLSAFMALAAPGIILFGAALWLLSVPLLMASISVNLLALSFKMFSEYGAAAGRGLLEFTYTALFAIPGLLALAVPLAIVGPLMLMMGMGAVLAATSMLILAHAINVLAGMGIGDILRISFVLGAMGASVLAFSILLGISAPFIILFGTSLIVLAGGLVAITIPALIMSNVMDDLVDSLDRAIDVFSKMGNPAVIFGMLAFALALPFLSVALLAFSSAMLVFYVTSLIFGDALNSLIQLGLVGPGILEASVGIEKLGKAIGTIGGRSVRGFSDAIKSLAVGLFVISSINSSRLDNVSAVLDVIVKSIVNMSESVNPGELNLIATSLNRISNSLIRFSRINPYNLMDFVNVLKRLSNTGEDMNMAANGLYMMNNIIENMDINRINELTESIRNLSMALSDLGTFGRIFAMVTSRFTREENTRNIESNITTEMAQRSLSPIESSTSRVSSGLVNIGRSIYGSKEKEGDIAIVNNTTTSTTASPIYSPPPAGMQIRDGEPSFRRINMLQFAGARV